MPFFFAINLKSLNQASNSGVLAIKLELKKNVIKKNTLKN